MTDAAPAPPALADCPHCRKPLPLCVCEAITPVANRVALVILQHPQEQDRTLGSAGLAARLFKNAEIRIGLSWPSLSKMLGREATASQWGVVYLGSVEPRKLDTARNVIAVTRKGTLAPDQDRILDGLEGVIVLDGTWSQAKALWWRNAWMLKCRRLVLNPKTPSAYGRLRKEPRREALSTIEAAGLLLAELEHDGTLSRAADQAFALMLDRFRAVKRTHPELTRR